MLTEIVPESDKSYWKCLVFEIAESGKESPPETGDFCCGVIENKRYSGNSRERIIAAYQ